MKEQDPYASEHIQKTVELLQELNSAILDQERLTQLEEDGSTKAHRTTARKLLVQSKSRVEAARMALEKRGITFTDDQLIPLREDGRSSG